MFDKPVDSTFEDVNKIIAIGKIDYNAVEDKSGVSLSKKEIAELAKAMKAACANAKKRLKEVEISEPIISNGVEITVEEREALKNAYLNRIAKTQEMIEIIEARANSAKKSSDIKELSNDLRAVGKTMVFNDGKVAGTLAMTDTLIDNLNSDGYSQVKTEVPASGNYIDANLEPVHVKQRAARAEEFVTPNLWHKILNIIDAVVRYFNKRPEVIPKDSVATRENIDTTTKVAEASLDLQNLRTKENAKALEMMGASNVKVPAKTSDIPQQEMPPPEAVVKTSEEQKPAKPHELPKKVLGDVAKASEGLLKNKTGEEVSTPKGGHASALTQSKGSVQERQL